jgi:hypothetical protein
LEFFGDQVGAAADAFVADFAAVTGNQPEDLVVRFAAERAVTVAHEDAADSIPQSLSGAVLPLSLSAAFRMKYVVVGKVFSAFQFETAESHLRFVSTATAFVPPRASITALTVGRSSVAMPSIISELLNSQGSWKINMNLAKSVRPWGAAKGSGRIV